ncbi:hypothetical protein BJ322DRAFT_1089522 [Thelephora terrestris]|uniref:Uncharacterized protein n=1 Tax=Thelephora terrestris TaxID=56493 RepID=A0A9P6H7I8_9AGAM|nr:hypothetical protein BJ322DRAFT_1089522 [Thelephora terrestris]
MPSVILEVDAAPKFAFLALPPPPKKKRAAVDNTFRAPVSPVNRAKTILAWAETVHPGSPVPMTPASGVSLPRSASSVSSPRIQVFRRSSAGRIPSASFLQFVDTPRTPSHPIPATPFPADAKFDLTAFGYSSVFVDVSVTTPITPDIYKPKPMTRLPSRQDVATASAPTTPVTKSTGMFKRLLGNKPKPAKPLSKAPGRAEKPPANPVVSDYVSVSRKKRSKYSEQPSGVEKKKREVYAAALPPTVKQEAQMRQAMEGGSLEYNIRKVMEEKAKREGTAVKVESIEGAKLVEGVETVHRDARGGIWWDQDEEWEFAHLLATNRIPVSARCLDSEGWVTFDNLKSKNQDDQDHFTDLSSLPSSKCTDLYHIRPLLVLDDSTDQLVRGRTKRSSSIVGSIILPSPKSPKILLSIPSRPTRAKHLLQPGFIKDVVAVPPTPSSTSAYSQASSHPRSPGRVTRFVVGGSSTSGSARRQRSRSRSVTRKQRKAAPPPLKIVPLGPSTKLAVNVELEDDCKKLFLEDSYKPDPITSASRWSKDTAGAASRPSLTKQSDSDNSVDNFALVSVPKKSRGLGGLFKKSERK